MSRKGPEVGQGMLDFVEDCLVNKPDNNLELEGEGE